MLRLGHLCEEMAVLLGTFNFDQCPHLRTRALRGASLHRRKYDDEKGENKGYLVHELINYRQMHCSSL